MDHRSVPKNKRLRIAGFFPESARLLKEWSGPREDVYHHLELEIGKGSEEHVELFSVTVATVEGLAANVPADHWVLADHGTIIVRDFDPRLIRMHIEETLARCEAPTLHEAMPLLQRYFRSERDD